MFSSEVHSEGDTLEIFFHTFCLYLLLVRMEYFLPASVNKGCQSRSSCSIADGELWTLREPRKERIPAASAAIRLQPPYSEPWGISGHWLQIAEVYQSEWCQWTRPVSSHDIKSAKFLNWDIWFSLINNHLLTLRPLALHYKTSIYPDLPPHSPALPLPSKQSWVTEMLSLGPESPKNSHWIKCNAQLYKSCR